MHPTPAFPAPADVTSNLSFMENHKNQPAHRPGSQKSTSRHKVMFFRKLTNVRFIIVVFRSCYIMLPPILQEVSEKNSLIQRIAVLQGEHFPQIAKKSKNMGVAFGWVHAKIKISAQSKKPCGKNTAQATLRQERMRKIAMEIKVVVVDK